ncbi:DUF6600 domain-containing protein [Pseudoduganella aquatica]|uniref:FecR protein domain-containing protein n=1 Tax=Pseudoduganella aquatica TaxID=2660641 RepID=A0A7X4H8L0_9BURK|nr:DUF6600 domain-containing protein [Pseudoduganella aquatica]MYN05932.1 hypothetical protein [Pseudoduganella aquatica]
MGRKFVHLILLTALVAVSSLALAGDDPPARVGRISSAEGQVTVEADGEQASGNLLNWPVAGGSRVTAAPGSRLEFRIGSAAIRLDGDSSLEVEALDDDSLRLRLNYGSVSVRLRSGELLGDFELNTPQARITMLEPGLVRVDSERQPDTSVISVLAGAASVDGGGAALTLRAGKRAVVQGEQVSTGQAQRDRFDDWVLARDKRDENSQSLRYVTADVTGYEELDQYGSWRESEDYGPLWSPRSVPVGWAPYRDGRWTWLDPWGWTWVDDAPWGYAPSHYGRWVMLDARWYWAPGRITSRPVWAPALVGWVGGSNWSVAFADRRNGPGVGWYPLTPRDRFVPNYRVSAEHERRLGWSHQNSVHWKPQREVRREGVTVLPREQFDARRTVNVGKAPRISLAPNDARNVPLSTAPMPANRVWPGAVTPGRVIETRRDRDHERDNAAERQPRMSINPGQNRAPAQQQAMPFAQPPAAAPQAADRNGDEDRRRAREENDRREAGQRWNRQSIQAQQQAQPQPQQQAQPQPPAQHPFAQPAQAAPSPAAQFRQRDDGAEQRMREQREQRDQQRAQREQRDMQAARPAPVAQPPQPQPQQAQPAPRPQPPPQMQAPQPRPQQQRDDDNNNGRRRGGDKDEHRQRE